MSAPKRNPSSQRALGNFIFLSRWLQAPLYVGLIVTQGVYVYHFFIELWHLLAWTDPISTMTAAEARAAH